MIYTAQGRAAYTCLPILQLLRGSGPLRPSPLATRPSKCLSRLHRGHLASKGIGNGYTHRGCQTCVRDYSSGGATPQHGGQYLGHRCEYDWAASCVRQSCVDGGEVIPASHKSLADWLSTRQLEASNSKLLLQVRTAIFSHCLSYHSKLPLLIARAADTLRTAYATEPPGDAGMESLQGPAQYSALVSYPPGCSEVIERKRRLYLHVYICRCVHDRSNDGDITRCSYPRYTVY